MSDTVIKVENLGKKYLISHLADKREQLFSRLLVNKAKTAGSKVLDMFRSAGGGGGGEHTTEEFWALKDVSFEIKQGDRVGIIGRNGAGKSTLLKVLSRITEPTTGRITIDGRVASLLEVGTGFHSELTGRENIYLNGAILGMSREEIKRKFDEIVAFAEVEQFLDTPVKRYSSGMYVRLAFAVAAHLEPEILIVDEVLAVGDAQFQKKCLGKMEDVSTKEGRTVLFVSHNMAAINNLCDTALWLNKGKLELIGDVEQITSKYLFYGTESSGEVFFPDKNLDSRFCFKKLALLNNESEISTVFDIRQPIKIQVEYHATSSLNNLELSLRVYNSLGTPIFTTNRSSFCNLEMTKGTHISEIIIPSMFLTPGQYSIDIAAHIPNIEVISNHQSIASFEVEETGSNMLAYKGLDHGVVILNIPWEEK